MKAIAKATLSLNQESLHVESGIAHAQPAQLILGNVLSSEKLFGNHNEVVIRHQNERYVLRLTKQNKLILTK